MVTEAKTGVNVHNHYSTHKSNKQIKTNTETKHVSTVFVYVGDPYLYALSSIL